jgi:hypothetical protein
MRYTIFIITCVALSVITAAAQSGDDITVASPWLDIILERGLAVALVLGGAWFVGFKVYPDIQRFAGGMMSLMQSIDHKLDVLLSALKQDV